MTGLAPFLRKTLELVEDPGCDAIISWNAHGTALVVWKAPEFARDLLPVHFKHCNFSSFVRQLNTYGFKKVFPDRWEFANEFFQRGKRHLLEEIQRRKNVSRLPPSKKRSLHSISSSNTTSSSSLLSEPEPEPETFGTSDELKKLRNENLRLLSELSSLRTLSKDLLLYLQGNTAPTVDPCATKRQALGKHNNLRDNLRGSILQEGKQISMGTMKDSDCPNHASPLKLFGFPLQERRPCPEPAFHH